MKKLFLFILSIFIGFSLAAQPYTSKDFKHIVKKSYKTISGVHDETTYVPTHQISPLMLRGNEVSQQIGATYYNSATNSNARNTISWSPDGTTCAAVWTMGHMPGNVRGTGINYFDKTDGWDPIPNTADRIEKGDEIGNPGWGAHVFTAEGECVIAHSVAAGGSGGLLINYREKHGEGEWTQYLLKGPNLTPTVTKILWPTVCAVGNTIHMVCLTDTEYEFNGYPGYPIYYRSKDGGKTWENFKTFEGIIPATDFENVFTGDDYVITAKGDHVVIAYANSRAVYLESKDGGNTWKRVVVYDNNWSWVSTDKQIGPLMAASTIAVAIDDNDQVHIAFGSQMRRRDVGTQSWHYSSYPALCGMYTWKEGHPLMKEEDMGIIYDFTNEEFIELNYDKLSNFMDAPDLLGFDQFYWWLPFDPLNQIVDNYSNVGYISHPRLIATGGKVYLSYSSIIEQPMLCPESGEFHRGVFLTVSHDNGETYNQKANTSWLSYHPDLFFCNWDNYLGPDSTGEGYEGTIDVVNYSENGYPTMSINVMNDMLVLTWLNDLFPFPGGSAPPMWSTIALGVWGTHIKLSQAGKYNNTDMIWKNLDISENKKIENLKIYPNPANNLTTIDVGTNNSYTLTVTNIMGQIVHTEKGQKRKVELNVDNYPAGIYIVSVKTTHAVTSQKLLINK